MTELYGLDQNATIDDGVFDVSNDDYKSTVDQLYPKGLAGNVAPGGTMEKLFCGIAQEPSRVDIRALDLLDEYDVRTAQELLPEWEELLGLPDPCEPVPSEDLADRQDAAHFKLTSRGAVTESYFIVLANGLGYPDAELRSEHNPFQCGVSTCGDLLMGGQWTYTWTMVLQSSTLNDAKLQCQVREAAEAHSIVHFEYPGQSPATYIIENPF